MRYIAVLAVLATLAGCKTTNNKYSDIDRSADLCMAAVVEGYKAKQMTKAQAEYGLSKCEQDANMQAQMRYLSTRGR